MSKKEQKLKKNLYKTFTEYFIHNPKNSLTSSESILDQLASFRMETGLPAALRQDKKYQKTQKKCNKANEKIRDLNLTPQQWDTVDAAITAENISSIEYMNYWQDEWTMMMKHSKYFPEFYFLSYIQQIIHLRNMGLLNPYQ